MQLSDLPRTDVREVLVDQRRGLIAFLASLRPEQWSAQTEAPDWSVKDVTLHLLDDDLRWLAHGRDHDRSGIIDVPADHEAFVRALGEHNQRWITGTRVLSHRLIIDLLRWSGEELTRYLASVDLSDPSSVYWAGDVPLWFDVAREFTERWVHERQIREAVLDASDRPQGGDEYAGDEYMDLVVRTFVWAFPHQYKAQAQLGSVVVVDISGVGTWKLTRSSEGWVLDEGGTPEPAAALRMTADAAWRLLTGARYDPGQVEPSGNRELAEPLTRVRSIIV